MENTWITKRKRINWKERGGRLCTRYCTRKYWKQATQHLKREIHHYCENTTLHGFRYITAYESTIIEKFIWLVVCLLGFGLGIFLMLLVWQRFLKTPTVTTIDTTTSPIWNLPFPAVTICNYNKVYRPRAEILSKELAKHGLNDTEIDNFFISLPKLIRPEYISVDIMPAMRVLEHLDITTEKLMHRLMQPCSKLLVRCTWLGQKYDCTKIFKTVKSIEGYCCAFNYHVVSSDVHVESPQPNHARSNNVSIWLPGVNRIQMVPGASKDVGLTVALDVEGDTYRGSIRPFIGASIMIHDPSDYPETDFKTTIAQPTHEVAIALSGTIIHSLENVRDLNLKRRNCWFDDEMKLKISTEYSYHSCITQCRMKYAMQLCNCLPFYYPNIFEDVRTCNLSDINCMWIHNRELSSLRKLIDVEVDINESTSEAECACLPQCSDISYQLDIESASLANVQYDSSILRGLDIRNISLVYLYFRDVTCLKYRREIMMSWDDLLASFGGIFGLCVGGSFMSLVELLYYFTIKIFHPKKKKKKTGLPRATKLLTVCKEKLDEWPSNVAATRNNKWNDLGFLERNIYFREIHVARNDTKMWAPR